MARFRVEVLTASHHVANFHCGEDEDDLEIADYLRHDALIDCTKGLAQTFVLIDQEKPVTENSVAGFFTLRAYATKIHERFFEDYEDYDEETAMEAIEVPLVELMYLARDSAWGRQGIGDVLIIETIKKVAQAAAYIGFVGLHLRSTEQGKRLYERYPFQPFHAHHLFDGARYIMPLSDILLLTEEVRRMEILAEQFS